MLSQPCAFFGFSEVSSTLAYFVLPLNLSAKIVASLNCLFAGYKPQRPILTAQGCFNAESCDPELSPEPLPLVAITEYRGDWKFFKDPRQILKYFLAHPVSMS